MDCKPSKSKIRPQNKGGGFMLNPDDYHLSHKLTYISVDKSTPVRGKVQTTVSYG